VSRNFWRAIQTVPPYSQTNPYLKPEDINQALCYAAATVDDESLSIDRVA